MKFSIFQADREDKIEDVISYIGKEKASMQIRTDICVDFLFDDKQFKNAHEVADYLDELNVKELITEIIETELMKSIINKLENK